MSGRRGRRIRAAALAATALLLVGAAVWLWRPDSESAPVETGEANGRPATAPGTGLSVASRHGCRESGGSSPSTFDPAAGDHAAYITGFSGSEISFDVVQWLSGDDAVEAYHRENPEDPGEPPNDYFIVNQSTQVRTAPVAAHAPVWLVRLSDDADADVDAGSLDELPAYLESGFPEDVYWLTFDDGIVMEICQQYRP